MIARMRVGNGKDYYDWRLAARTLEDLQNEVHGADINKILVAQNSMEIDAGYTILHYAVQLGGDRDIVKALFARGADVHANTGGKKYRTPLHLAAGFGHEDIAKLLIDAEADVDAKDYHGETPLHLAVTKLGNIKVVEALLAAGAKPNTISQTNFGNSITPILKASAMKEIDIEIIKALINGGADVNAKDRDGNTPLHYVIKESGNVEAVRMLIPAKADVNAQNNFGDPFLSYAARHKRKEIVKLLLGKSE